MVRYVSLLALLVFSSSAWIAGVEAQTVLSFRGGASIASLGGDDVQDADSRTGVNVGAAVTFGLSENLGVQIGGTYAQKGATQSEDGVDITFKLDYIEVPALLIIGVPTEGTVSPRFFVGPAFSVEAGCEAEGSSQGFTATVSCSDAGAQINSIDIGAMGGAGLSIATGGSLSVTLDVLYNLGLSSIDDTSNPDDVKNRAWSLLAGVSFPVGSGPRP